MFKALLYILSISVLLVSALDVTASNIRQVLTPQSATFEYFNNDSKTYSIRQIQQLKPSQWIAEPDFKTDKLSNHHYWLHVRVPINIKTVEPLFLEVSNRLIDKITVYMFRGQQSRTYWAGSSIVADSQSSAASSLYFPLPNNRAEYVDIYIEYQDETTFQLSLAITDHNESIANVNAQGIFVGMITGLIFVLLIVTLIVYREKQSSLLRHYLGLLLFSGITILSLEEINLSKLWISLPWLQNLLIPSLLLCTLWCSISVIKALISNKISEYPLIKLSFKWIANVTLAIAPILLILPSAIASFAAIIVLCISAVTISALLLTFTAKSRVLQTWLLIAWFTLITTLMLKAFSYTGLLSLPSFTLSIATSLYCLQLLLLFAIILQHYCAKKALLHDENTQLINELKIQNTEVNESLTQHHKEHLDLEALINERTFELNVTLRELQDTNRQLQEQATNDALTGVKNRKFFDKRLQAEYRLSRRQHTPLSLLLLDVDKFKLVNDNYGHLVGDKVLIEICKIASDTLKRPNDYVCRYGGEEFAILLSHTDEKGALKVAESIRQKIEDATITTNNETLKVTVSIGISVLMIEESTPETLLFEQADKALYFAKESGRNNVKNYSEYQVLNK